MHNKLKEMIIEEGEERERDWLHDINKHFWELSVQTGKKKILKTGYVLGE